jgi:hypothetical protein
MSRASGFRLEFIPIEIGAGMTFLEGPLRVTPEGQLKLRTIEKKEFGIVHGRMFAVKVKKSALLFFTLHEHQDIFYSIMAMVASASTSWPAETHTSLITPPTGATRGISIFMASKTAT